MPSIKLIADSGSTKTEWCLLKNNKPTVFISQGMSPYFVDAEWHGKNYEGRSSSFFEKKQN